MSTTIRDVAKRAGVGIGTVSRVLNDHTAVREATRQRVLDAIRELNYVPNPIARQLSTGRTMTIGVVAPFFTAPFFAACSVVVRWRQLRRQQIRGSTLFGRICFSLLVTAIAAGRDWLCP